MLEVPDVMLEPVACVAEGAAVADSPFGGEVEILTDADCDSFFRVPTTPPSAPPTIAAITKVVTKATNNSIDMPHVRRFFHPCFPEPGYEVL